MSALSVAEARRRVLEGVAPLPAEPCPIAAAAGRVLAEAVSARRTQPPFDASAMDGYAVRAADAAAGARLDVVGESAAGHGFAGSVSPGEAVRIFTGAPVPAGADAVLIQENVRRDGDVAVVDVAATAGQNIRRRGLDFTAGTPALAAGIRLGPREVALCAALNHPALSVRRRPRVAILATGDEIVAPGETVADDRIVASNSFALAAMAEAEGATAIDLGIAPDRMEAIEASIDRAASESADILVTIGGASVGDHDLVQKALTNRGMDLGFWRIAMRPGKPMMHGRLGPMLVLGLPGNPVSAVVCGVLFLVPLIRRLTGRAEPDLPRLPARLAVPLPPNDWREDYLRATLARDPVTGEALVTPAGLQDSSLVSVLASADALLIRPPHAPASPAGERCTIVDLRSAGL